MMNVEEKQNNKVFLSGVIVTEAKFSHEVYGEGFYEMEVNVKRLSGQADILPVTISERLIESHNLSVGSTICAIGQFRSYNKLVDGKSKLMLTVFVREIVDGEGARNPNNIVLSGYICKPPVYRTTPFRREICDVLLAINRAYNKSDYIPMICWGRNARFAGDFAVGQKVAVTGRIQSRNYTKMQGEEQVLKTAFEVSAAKIEAVDEEPTKVSAEVGF